MQVWSEPEMVEAAAYEFADTAKYVETGEVDPKHLLDWDANPGQAMLLWFIPQPYCCPASWLMLCHSWLQLRQFVAPMRGACMTW